MKDLRVYSVLGFFLFMMSCAQPLGTSPNDQSNSTVNDSNGVGGSITNTGGGGGAGGGASGGEGEEEPSNPEDPPGTNQEPGGGVTVPNGNGGNIEIPPEALCEGEGENYHRALLAHYNQGNGALVFCKEMPLSAVVHHLLHHSSDRLGNEEEGCECDDD